MNQFDDLDRFEGERHLIDRHHEQAAIGVERRPHIAAIGRAVTQANHHRRLVLVVYQLRSEGLAHHAADHAQHGLAVVLAHASQVIPGPC